MSKIDNNPFEITLEPGKYLDRFSVTFKSGENDEDDENHKQSNIDSLLAAADFVVYMNNTTPELQTSKPVDAEIETVKLYNYLGQLVKTWNTNINESVIYLPIKVSAGAYIVQINTKNGTVGHRVIID